MNVPFYGVRRLAAWFECSWLRSEPEVGQGADAADGTSGYFSHKKSFSLHGFNKKGYFFQQRGEATSGPGIPDPLRGIFWAYSQ